MTSPSCGAQHRCPAAGLQRDELFHVVQQARSQLPPLLALLPRTATFLTPHLRRPPIIPLRSVFPAPAGGPIAALRDDSKLVLYVGGFTKPDVQVFSGAGAPLGRVLWDGGHVLAAGWTAGEQLLVLEAGAKVRLAVWVDVCVCVCVHVMREHACALVAAACALAGAPPAMRRHGPLRLCARPALHSCHAMPCHALPCPALAAAAALGRCTCSACEASACPAISPWAPSARRRAGWRRRCCSGTDWRC